MIDSAPVDKIAFFINDKHILSVTSNERCYYTKRGEDFFAKLLILFHKTRLPWTFSSLSGVYSVSKQKQMLYVIYRPAHHVIVRFLLMKNDLKNPEAFHWKVSHFVILHKLGEGGMGVIYAAYDTSLDRKVALKFIRPSLVDRQDVRLRMIREAQSMAKLSHPNVAQIYEVGEAEGQIYLAIEFIQGMTLQKWILTKKPSWQQILHVLISAGWGLVAAHKVGLVHRDFKPDNILVGDDGRARVVDFGLVHKGIAATKNTFPSNELSTEQRLTSFDHFVGTPIYMSPEQHQNRELDERSDQFSFCITLYEALYGVLPYSATNLDQRWLQIQAGEIQLFIQRSKVPYWIYSVIRRGLSADPDQRWPNMEALLNKLSYTPSRKRMQWIGAAAIAGSIGSLSYIAATYRANQVAICRGAEKEFIGIWDPQVKAELNVSIRATGIPYAGETIERLTQNFDHYMQQWIEVYVEACETHHEARQSSQIFDLRNACLQHRKRQFAALVDVLLHADITILQNATQAASSLKSIHYCSDVEALSAEVPPPEDPQINQQINLIRNDLDKANVLELTGQYGVGIELVQQLVLRAKTTHYLPIQAETFLQLGSLQMETGNFSLAEEYLSHAFHLAIESRADKIAVEALSKQLFVIGSLKPRIREALAQEDLAWALLRRLKGQNRELEGLLFNNLGAIYDYDGQRDKAQVYYKQAIQAWISIFGPDHPMYTTPLYNLANSLQEQHKLIEAELAIRQAAGVIEDVWGGQHPRLTAFFGLLGRVLYEQGRLFEAKSYLQRAITISEQNASQAYYQLITPFVCLGKIALDENQDVLALQYFERAMQIWQKEPFAAGEYENVLLAFGDFYLHQGNWQKAQEFYEKVRIANEKDPQNFLAARPYIGLAKIAIEQKQYMQAQAYLEKAVILHQSTNAPPQEINESRYLLARVLWQMGTDSQRTLKVSQLAQKNYLQFGSVLLKTYEQISQWYSDHAALLEKSASPSQELAR